MIKSEYLSELFIPYLKKEEKIPQYIQLFRALQSCILEGKLASGAKLPASRPLAQSLKVSRNTVKAAFELLQAEGYIQTRLGAGTFVSDTSSVQLKLRDTNSTESAPPIDIQFSELMTRLDWKSHQDLTMGLGLLAPALPAMSQFPWIQWQRAVNYAGRVMKHESPKSEFGCEELREQIADYLKIVRGVKCNASNLLIFSGSQQAIYFTLQLLINPGDSVFVEDPCYYGINGAVNALGAVKVPIPVDESGFDLLPADYHKSKLAVVTPSRNYPLGHTMSLSRRMALLNWANSENGWIIEDDYDSEFRFDKPPLTSLQGLSNGQRVIYAGTFSRILHQSIRIGYLVLPDELVAPFSVAKRLMHGSLPVLPQLALAKFMANGHFSSHVRKMRKLYRGRREILRELIASQLSEYLELISSDGGMHCVYYLTHKLSDIQICQQADKQGLAIRPLSSYYSLNDSKQGLVIGFAGFTELEQRKAIAALKEVMTNVD
jgi:GntR family transcriptional regulator/MocR family aminotransferase